MERAIVFIPNDIRLIKVGMVGAVTYAQALDFPEKECHQIELILEEVLSNVIKHNFIQEQTEHIETEIESTTLGIGIRIKTKGIPMDIDAIKNFETLLPDDILNHNAHGLGVLLIKNLADEVVYTNKGKDGQEIWIEKYLPFAHIDKDKSLKPLDTAKVAEPVHLDFYFRRIRPEESPLISRLAYYTYNLSYIYEHIYYPDRVKALNEKDEMMSYVAVNKANEEIVGHCALLSDDLSGMREMAVAFVNPAYRGSGCLKELSKYQITEIEKMGIDGVFVHAVTTHSYSQKAAYGQGLKETALFISRLTALQMNKINSENTIRESLLYQCKFFSPLKHRKIYAPGHHKDMISRIFSNIGPEVQSYEIVTSSNEKSGKGLCVVGTKADAYLCNHIFVKQYGTDILNTVMKLLKTSCINRLETIYLYLPLEFAETYYLCSDFESMGFFFGGLRPGNEGKFWLLMQYLNNQTYDYENLQFCSGFGQELRDYIRNNDPNID